MEISRKIEKRGNKMSNQNNYKIIHLPKEQWTDYKIPMRYTTHEYFDVVMKEEENKFNVELEKKPLETPISHYPEEYDFPDRLYQDCWRGACAWGVLDEKEELIACIETCPEEWFNRLRVCELWVHENYRRQGIAHRLMAVAKEQARLERRRAIILETQSCNEGAIAFYRQEGFTLIGFDSCCYSNRDIERKEVRMELGILYQKPAKLTRQDVEIRMETEADYHATEVMTQRAFWNLHHKGCDEHYLVHKMRQHPAYLPELSRIAVKDGEVIGCICYCKSWLEKDGVRTEVTNFGPLCVDPRYQGMGVGELLLAETIPLAKAAGFPGILIFGEPGYYPLHGFVTSDKFGITNFYGENFDAFMAYELIPGALSAIGGRFVEPDVFENLPKEEVEEYNKKFPYMEKQYFPMQWD